MSTIIKMRCIDQVLTFESTPVIASGGLEEDTLQVSFCSKWDGLAKTAVFWKTDDEAYHAPLDLNDSCVIPREVLADEGVFYFGIFGVSQDGRQRTTEAVRYTVAKGAITSGTKPSDPTPDVYTQLLARYAEVQSIAQQSVASADASAKAAEASRKAAESASDGAVARDGSKVMTGNLTIEKATPIVRLRDTATGSEGTLFNANDRLYLQVQNDVSTDANRRQLQLIDSEAQTLDKSFVLVEIVDGEAKGYLVYHQGNKPTAVDVGAFGFASNIAMDNTDPIVYPTVKSNATRLRVYSGQGAQYSDGASLILTNKTATSDAGAFNLTAHDGANGAALTGKPDGTLTWRGQPLYHQGNKPTTADVGAMGFYGSFEELGLTEATATVEAIVNAMANGSLLMVSCSTAGATSGLLPSKYGLLVVEKRNNNYVNFEYRNGSGFWRGYYNAASGSGVYWTGWSLIATADSIPTTAAAVGAVALNGSNAMTGNLNIQKDNPSVGLKHTTSGAGAHFTMTNHEVRLQIANVNGDSSNRRYLQLFDSAGQSDVANAMILVDLVPNQSAQGYPILHTGNITKNGVAKIKCGSYVGTGAYGSGNPVSLTFDFEPKVLIVTDSTPSVNYDNQFMFERFIWIKGVTEDGGNTYGSYGERVERRYSTAGNTISWYAVPTEAASAQFNDSGVTYHYVAIG